MDSNRLIVFRLIPADTICTHLYNTHQSRAKNVLVPADAQSVVPAAAHFAQDSSRPLITARDIAFLIYYYPLRWLAGISGDRLSRLLLAVAQPLSRVVQRRDLHTAERKMAAMLQLPSNSCRQLARQYLNHRVRAALFTLHLWRRGSAALKVRWLGREHLERALDQQSGVVLLTLHCLAKREARFAMRQAGRDFRPVVHGAQRSFPGHGRLLWRFARSRLLPLQWSSGISYITSDDPNAVLEMVSTLREGGILLISPDVIQSASATPVRFMHVTRPFSTGVLDIARLTGCTVVPMWVSYEPDGCAIQFHPPVPFETRGNRDEVRSRNLALLIQVMEQQLKAHPAQWEFWDRPVAGH
jgi:lauroyl/myristoyl acyltransferase